MSLEAGIGLFILGSIVTPVFLYYLFKFIEATEREHMNKKDKE
jgi:hypothetical protein